jgi:ATP-dependent DNA helicase RecG
VPNGTINDTINGTINSEDINTQLIILINDNPSITMDCLSEKTGYSRRTVTRQLKELQENGTIKRIGSRKTGHWEVIGNQ